jgi:hypothetical protein
VFEVFDFGLDRLTVVGRMKRFTSGSRVKVGRTTMNEVDSKALRMLRAEEDFKGDGLDYLMDSVWLKIKDGRDYTSYVYNHWFRIGDHCFIQVYTGKERYGNDIRIDWNPAKVEEDEEWFIKELLGYVSNKDFTRIDLKIDLRADFSKGWKVVEEGGCRKTHDIRSACGDLETFYFGTPNSECQTVIYNKAIEQNRHRIEAASEEERERIRRETKYEKWWRIEERIKGSRAKRWENHKWFENLKFVKEGVDVDWGDLDLKPNDKATLIACSVYPELIKEFGKQKRSKIKKMMAETEIKKSTTVVKVVDLFETQRCKFIEIKRFLQKVID